MWTVAGRRFRRKTQQTTTTLLGTELGSGSGSSGRFSAELEDQGTLSISTLEINSAGIEVNQGAEIEESNTSNTTMAKLILVSNGFKNETHRTTNNLDNKRKMVISRMAIINNYRISKGLEKQTTKFLNQKTRESTQGSAKL
ncbi:hypothetical protein G6F47_007374 [Rhizopus delemar]|uniref:Uncharacterized protein n=3 Tax=Rhizopus TaxID=4842 RepID=I1CEV1_RHIO9|nr:hypothetical protein RO3G_11692 [Rhizopus delemar RA 99-880]KAG1490636.1 hypothetical protein G6F54_010584 [Rhizopus delemar]KAG1511716.1 hypothetical protein G6F52_010581 [Rhizopus delemar]KAG1591124.1 hypothetical protein G6F48_003506 [Rhizopus delemar]KAG1597373.1 hypothetical protein G6F47_007374 [Rhizopus delemar]|eukprot:EIE86981.1 hypothetical protein RO3G_11692 [Rhizopus delemar RA 99-880]